MNDCRVILVRPHYAGNVGAIARVMHNFGLSKLILVDPLADHRGEEARRLATHGEFILEQATIAPNLNSALSDCLMTAATSANVGGVVRETGSGLARALMPRFAEVLHRGPVGLVFGPEPSGLTTAEIGLCTYLVHVPTNPTYPALNLAQAAAICLYELHEAWSAAVEPPAGETPAPFEDQERMYARLQKALEAVHFLYAPKSESLMHALKHLIGRAGPTTAEVKILHGLARQLEWVAAHGASVPHDPHDSS